MDTRQQIEQMQKRIDTLEKIVRSLTTASDMNPDVIYTFENLGFTKLTVSNALVTNYDQAVDEGDTGTYTVPKIQDGHLLYGTDKLIPYYDVI